LVADALVVVVTAEEAEEFLVLSVRSMRKRGEMRLFGPMGCDESDLDNSSKLLVIERGGPIQAVEGSGESTRTTRSVVCVTHSPMLMANTQEYPVRYCMHDA
jgi:hypothetical protein